MSNVRALERDSRQGFHTAANIMSMNSFQLLEIRDEPALRFVCAVIAQHLTQAQSPRIELQLKGEESPLKQFMAALSSALSIEARDWQSEGHTHVLSNGSRLTVGSSSAESNPDLLLNAVVSKERRATRSKPYLFHLHMQSIGMSGLMTQLLPKYWSLHPAYEIIREAKREQ